jgi:hypothetical protein
LLTCEKYNSGYSKRILVTKKEVIVKTALGDLRVSKKKPFREEVYGSLKKSSLHGKLKACSAALRSNWPI